MHQLHPFLKGELIRSLYCHSSFAFLLFFSWDLPSSSSSFLPFLSPSKICSLLIISAFIVFSPFPFSSFATPPHSFFRVRQACACASSLQFPFSFIVFIGIELIIMTLEVPILLMVFYLWDRRTNFEVICFEIFII